MLRKVNAGQVDRLRRRRPRHAADFNGRYHCRPGATDLEVQVFIQGRRRGVFTRQQLRQVELVAAWGEIVERVMAAVVLLPDESVAAIATDQNVIAAAPFEHIIACTAVEHVVGTVADQGIVIVRADQVVNATEGLNARTSSVLRPFKT
ncbi:hypothetical protein D3C79_648360 [compost metagenome]